MTASYLSIRKTSIDRRQGIQSQLSKNIGGMPHSVMGTGSSGLGMFRNDSTRKKQVQAYDQFRSWVFVCANYIAKRHASQPIIAGEKVGAAANPVRSADGNWYTKSGTRILKARDLSHSLQQKNLSDVEVISDHPSIDALCRPNYLQGTFEFRYMSAINLLLTGESYWLLGSEPDEKTGEEKLEVWSIPTHWIEPSHKDGPYTGFWFKPPGVAGQGEPLDPDIVCRTYFTNPASLTGVWSPLHAILRASRIDDYLQYSQEQMFSRGINPNLILTMAQQRGPDGKPTGNRPRLTGDQRRQLIRGVREVWGNTMNYGDPAIIDGMIEGIHKLSASPSEMDWLNSDVTNKARIMQAFGVNPIVVGEIVGSNRAQAVEAEKSVCENAINPISDAFSATMTNRIGPLYDSPERLLLWVEPCKPIDTELRDRRWLDGHRLGIVDDDEVRIELYGLTAKEEEEARNPLLLTHTGWAQALATVKAMNLGEIAHSAAVELVALFLELETSVAATIVGPEPEEEPEEEHDQDELQAQQLQIADLGEEVAGVQSRLKTMVASLSNDIADVRGSGSELNETMLEFAKGVMQSLEEYSRENQEGARALVESHLAYADQQTIELGPKAELMMQTVAEVSTQVASYLKVIHESEDVQAEPFSFPEVSPHIEVNVSLPPAEVTVGSPVVKVTPNVNVESTHVTLPEMSPHIEVVSPHKIPTPRVAIIEHSDGTTSKVRTEGEPEDRKD